MGKPCSRMLFAARLQFNRFISSSAAAFPRRVVVTGTLSVLSSLWLPRTLVLVSVSERARKFVFSFLFFIFLSFYLFCLCVIQFYIEL